MRTYVRSTAAHNTVVVDDCEQSEIWGEFRVGRRAHRLYASIRRDGNKIIFKGAYRGFPTLSAIVHERTVELSLNDDGSIAEIKIDDSINGSDKYLHRVESLVHLNPQITTSPTGEKSFLIKHGDKSVAFLEGLKRSYIDSWHCPEFGKMLNNTVLQAFSKTVLPTAISYVIKPCHNQSDS
jgi:uncharacterized heparinase superfamily protein